MTAFVDESYRHGPGGRYIMAVVVLLAHDVDPREAARNLLLPGQRRLHWHDEDERRRAVLLDRLVQLGLECRSYFCPLGPALREPRARALCLNAVLWDLWQESVSSLVIESRGEYDDRRDRSTIVAAQKSMRASPTVAYRFERPSVDPMLWWADVVAGAAAASVSGSGLLEASGLQVIRTDVGS